MKPLHTITPEDIKQQLKISTVLTYYSTLVVNLQNGVYWCPLHEQGGKANGHKTPSLVAKDEKGTATCLARGCFESDDIFGIISKMENLTTSRALVSDGNGDVSVSAVTSTEIGYLDGVTSSIQTQIDTKTTKGFAIASAIVFG